MLFRIVPTLIRAGLFDKEAQKDLMKSIWGDEKTDPTPVNKQVYKHEYVWRNILLFVYLHIASLYGVYLLFTEAKALTVIAAILLYIAGGLGITAGAHRLWAHRSYKARLPLRILLTIFNTLAFQNHVIEWSRDHRVHHKHSETDADPHNATRGFFFAHMGWLLVRKHKDVKEKGKELNVDDLEADPILAFQKRFYVPLVLIVCFILPSYLPAYLWGESAGVAYYTCGLLRYCWTLHMTWLVNSAAHMIGLRPYDKGISPSENRLVSWGAIGEGWHNYHHTFPYDYRTSELGWNLNLTMMFIDFMAKIGLAYDLKIVPDDVVVKRMLRTGDGNRLEGRVNHNGHHHHDEIDESEANVQLVNAPSY